MKSIKMFWFYLCMPIGMGMMFLNIIANILERMKGGSCRMTYIILLICFAIGVPIVFSPLGLSCVLAILTDPPCP